MNITKKDIFNKFIELNKFLSNVCIIRVNKFYLYEKLYHSRSHRSVTDC
jgi:hypothetical protein